MLNHQLILIDEAGRLRCTFDPPDYFNGGTPTKDGLLCVMEAGGEVFVNSLGYVNNFEQVTLEQAVTPPSPGSNPLASPTGRLRVSDSLPMFWLYGLPMGADGQLCVVVGIPPPVDEGAFNTAFDNSFDIGA